MISPQNRRVARQVNGQWTYVVSDRMGNPISELAQTGDATRPWEKVRDYVWLEGRLLAQVEYGPTGGRTYYAHLDHLGTPRALTSESGQLVWSAFQRPYGEVGEKTVPDAVTGQMVVTNLRLPGQYDERLLGALGLQGPYYNWNRWYLPSVGRYLELDPIAKAGGFNGPFGPDWYVYAEGNPLTYYDSLGLMPFDKAGGDATQWYADQYVATGDWYYWVGGFFSALWTPETSAETFGTLLAAKGASDGCRAMRVPPPRGPRPPGWSQDWQWRYPEGTRPGEPRWFDPKGGEWRWHGPDKWHPDGHWDHNPWTNWNSPWQNVPHP